MAEVKPAVVQIEPKNLTDDIKVEDKTWSELKKSALAEDFQKQIWFINLRPEDKRLIESLRKTQTEQGDMNELKCQPCNVFRHPFWYVANSSGFEYFITGVIVLNTIAMCMEFYGAPQKYIYALSVANQVFVIIFTLEAVIKLIGLGTTYYFYIDWNKFDFSIVIVSLVSESPLMNNINLTAFRIIRVARLLRMLKSSKKL